MRFLKIDDDFCAFDVSGFDVTYQLPFVEGLQSVLGCTMVDLAMILSSCRGHRSSGCVELVDFTQQAYAEPLCPVVHSVASWQQTQ